MTHRLYSDFDYCNLSRSLLLITDCNSPAMEETGCYVGRVWHGLDGRNGSSSRMQAELTTLDGGSLPHKLFCAQEMCYSEYGLQCQDLTYHACGALTQSGTRIGTCAQYSIRQPFLGHELVYFLSACLFKKDFASEKVWSLLGCCLPLC